MGPALNPGNIISPPEHVARQWISEGRAEEVIAAAKVNSLAEISRPVKRVAAEIRKAVKKARR
jgi:hypothetical protein